MSPPLNRQGGDSFRRQAFACLLLAGEQRQSALTPLSSMI
jgi:hypothetical protein